MEEASPSCVSACRFLGKRSFDLLLASIALVLVSPLMVLIAVAIFLEDGRWPFFVQLRTGQNGVPFHIFKFRTLYDSPPLLFRQVALGDERVSRIGCLLRRWSIDEWPQLVNVLLGQMSLVGPRPHAVEHEHEFVDHLPNYQKRFVAPPGITGLAQIHDLRGTANLADMALRLSYDLQYIENWSLRQDFRILLATPMVCFRYRKRSLRLASNTGD